MPFLSACSAQPDWEQATAECIAQLTEQAQGMTLGFVYVSDGFSHLLQAIIEKLSSATGVDDWIGTVGLGICHGRREIYEQPAISLLLTDIDPDHYRLLAGQDQQLEKLEQLQPWYASNAATVGILHADPNNPSLTEMISGIAGKLPEGFLIGGLTSSRQDNPQVIGTHLTEGSISGTLFSEQVPIATAITQGCSPITPKRTITECQRNIVIRIDNRPALEVMQEDMGHPIQDHQMLGQTIFAGFPLTGSDTGDYLVRNLVGIDEKNQLIAVGEMLETGRNIMFCRRDKDTAHDDMHRMLENLKKRIGTQQPKGALYYSCLGRGRSLFGEDAVELNMIQDTLGDIPLTGFFCNGEIAHNQLYGFTGVVTVFL